MSDKKTNSYWRENIRILQIMLTVWIVVSFFLSIIFADELDTVRLGGFGLGFWMAQQGSIYIYVVMIYVYIWLMDKLDKKYGVDETSLHDSNREN